MEFERCTNKDFLNLFMAIMKSSKNNTYKFALARFLLEYSNNHTENHVRYKEIAAYFFKYYWIQECKSKLNQGPYNQTPEVIQIIRGVFSKPYYPHKFADLEKDEPAKVKKCIDMIAKKCFDDVIPRFQIIRNNKRIEKRIYYHYLAREYHDSADNKKIDPGGGVLLNPLAMEFFRKNYVLLSKTVILEWVLFLEGLNIGVPRLASKIKGIEFGKRDQTKFRKILEPFASSCFYCQKHLSKTKIHVEHVIPFDYIGETEMWNLVLSCGNCNCSKLGGLPPRKYMDNLIMRNNKYRDIIKELDKSLNILGTDFKDDIMRHYDNAKLHGYVVLRNFPKK